MAAKKKAAPKPKKQKFVVAFRVVVEAESELEALESVCIDDLIDALNREIRFFEPDSNEVEVEVYRD